MPAIVPLMPVVSQSEAAREARPSVRYRVHRYGGGLGVMIDEAAVFQYVDRRWILDYSRRESNWCGQYLSGKCVPRNADFQEFADERSCPALPVAMAALPSIWSADPAANPKIQGQIVTDTPMFTISEYRRKGSGRLSRVLTEFIGPTEDWWERTVARLGSCWTAGKGR